MITSVNNKVIKNLVKLKQKKYRDEQGLFLVEGYHLVEEARKANVIQTIVTTLDTPFEEETVQVSMQVMKKLAFTKTPQPVMAVCKKTRKTHVLKDGYRYLLLDQLQDPGNVGTIIRTALAFGYDQIIMSLDSVDLYNDKVLRSTQGAIFNIDICQMDLKETITELKEQGVDIYGTSLKDASSIETFKPIQKMAFVMGNEGQGVSQDILDMCDQLVYIPINTIESLNVGVASAIIMYHFKESENL